MSKYLVEKLLTAGEKTGSRGSRSFDEQPHMCPGFGPWFCAEHACTGRSSKHFSYNESDTDSVLHCTAGLVPLSHKEAGNGWLQHVVLKQQKEDVYQNVALKI